jgi:transposase
MRVVREVLRLTFAGVSKREVARRTGLASSTVRATIARFQSLGLIWPLPETITDSDLEAKIYKSAGKKPGHRRIIEPDWASLHREIGDRIPWPRRRSRRSSSGRNDGS